MAISCRNQQKILPIDTRTLRRTLLKLLAALACQSCDLGVLIVDDARMHRLNARYRGIDRPTDVLAFAMREGPFANLQPQVLGDVVISAETALRQARARRHSVAEELTRLLIHGTLHLLGYDHEVSPAASRLMRAKERELWELVAPMANALDERRPHVSDRR
ncbi:MAG TPA: rRNA maturation RNase YbeY [Candidatus Tectomicrobia bacterium]|nr:rRNA maturation RNase YbeY [Candidatus Tectomicrobia bacterium]